MDSENDAYGRMRELIDGLDELLDAAGSERSAGAKAKLAIAFCDHLGGRLDGDQVVAINAARDFWLRGEVDEYNKWSHLLCLKAGRQQLLHPIDRLVWSALVQTGRLDSYMVEYLALEAFDAGLTVDDISGAMVEVERSIGENKKS